MRIPHLARRALTLAGGGALVLGLAACGGDGDDQAPATGEQTSAAATTSPSGSGGSAGASDAGGATGEQPAADADLRTSPVPVSPEDAISTATPEAGDGTLHAVELDYSDKDEKWEYDVKILADGVDHKVVVDAASGAVLRHEQDSTTDQEKAIDLSSPMTYDQGLDKALATRDGQLRGWKLEYDDGRIAYQFDIAQGSDEKEVTVDVSTGQTTVD